MALMTRISRLFVADVNAILDNLEEPEALLKQAMHEMQDEMDRAESLVAQLNESIASTDAGKARLGSQLDTVNDKVALAMDADDADLARDMIRRRLVLQQHLDHLDDRRDALAQQLASTSERLSQWRDRYDAIAQKLSVLQTQAVGPTDEPSMGSVTPQDVQVAYLAELKKRQTS